MNDKRGFIWGMSHRVLVWLAFFTSLVVPTSCKNEDQKQTEHFDQGHSKMKIRQGNIKESGKLLARAIKVDPLYAESYYELAKISSNPETTVRLCVRGLLVSRDNSSL